MFSTSAPDASRSLISRRAAEGAAGGVQEAVRAADALARPEAGRLHHPRDRVPPAGPLAGRAGRHGLRLDRQHGAPRALQRAPEGTPLETFVDYNIFPPSDVPLTPRSPRQADDAQRKHHLMQKKMLEINPRHPMVLELLRRVTDDPDSAEALQAAKTLYRTAALR